MASWSLETVVAVAATRIIDTSTAHPLDGVHQFIDPFPPRPLPAPTSPVTAPPTSCAKEIGACNWRTTRASLGPSIPHRVDHMHHRPPTFTNIQLSRSEQRRWKAPRRMYLWMRARGEWCRHYTPRQPPTTLPNRMQSQGSRSRSRSRSAGPLKVKVKVKVNVHNAKREAPHPSLPEHSARSSWAGRAFITGVSMVILRSDA